MSLAPDVKAVVIRFVYNMWNGTFCLDLLKDTDYRQVLLDEPSSAEQTIAVFLNCIDVNNDGSVVDPAASRTTRC